MLFRVKQFLYVLTKLFYKVTCLLFVLKRAFQIYFIVVTMYNIVKILLHHTQLFVLFSAAYIPLFFHSILYSIYSLIMVIIRIMITHKNMVYP